MEENQYPVRYVAFLDILGFRDLIAYIGDDLTQLAFVQDLLRNIHRPSVDDSQNLFEDSDLRAQSISDAVAISSSATPAGLGHMFVALEALACKMLERGFFVRGAIAKGRLFHDTEMVFGDGLVAAYRYESLIARYARIMIPRAIAIDVERFALDKKIGPVFDGWVRRSKDGPQYLHVLRRLSEIKKMKTDTSERQSHLSKLVQIRDLIQRRLDEAVDEPSNFEKVHWFADYWNEVFLDVNDLHRIKGPGLEIMLAWD